MAQTGDFDQAIDFLKSGLVYNKTNEFLMYNFACANERMGRFEQSLRFF